MVFLALAGDGGSRANLPSFVPGDQRRADGLIGGQNIPPLRE